MWYPKMAQTRASLAGADPGLTVPGHLCCPSGPEQQTEPKGHPILTLLGPGCPVEQNTEEVHLWAHFGEQLLCTFRRWLWPEEAAEVSHPALDS
jgi:hypothetical protein